MGRRSRVITLACRSQCSHERIVVIGILGGMGPAAGVRFARLVVDRAMAKSDQDHPSFTLMSCPSLIPDRSAFLVGDGVVNPGYAIADVARQVAQLGATTVAMPCSTAHAPAILEPVLDALSEFEVTFCNLIEVAAKAAAGASAANCVGVLSTEGTRRIGLYEAALGDLGVRCLHPAASDQAIVSDVIRLVKSGVTPQTSCLDEPVGRLVAGGADLVLLGCTELPLAAPAGHIDGALILDPLEALTDAVLAAEFARRVQ
jgi:aspartate racemase